MWLSYAFPVFYHFTFPCHPELGLEEDTNAHLSHAFLTLGMTVSSDKDGTGMIVRSVIHGGSISRDGRINVGDCILSINEESSTNLTNAEARAMLRRHSLVGHEMK